MVRWSFEVAIEEGIRTIEAVVGLAECRVAVAQWQQSSLSRTSLTTVGRPRRRTIECRRCSSFLDDDGATPCPCISERQRRLRDAFNEGLPDDLKREELDLSEAAKKALELRREVDDDQIVAKAQRGVAEALLRGVQARLAAEAVAAEAAWSQARVVRHAMVGRLCSGSTGGLDSSDYDGVFAALRGVSSSAMRALLAGLNQDVVGLQTGLQDAQDRVQQAKGLSVEREDALLEARSGRDRAFQRLTVGLMVREVCESRLTEDETRGKRPPSVFRTVSQWFRGVGATGGGGGLKELSEAHEIAFRAGRHNHRMESRLAATPTNGVAIGGVGSPGVSPLRAGAADFGSPLVEAGFASLGFYQSEEQEPTLPVETTQWQGRVIKGGIPAGVVPLLGNHGLGGVGGRVVCAA